MAEGILTFTKVTRENSSALAFHTLKVETTSRVPGLTLLALNVETEELNPLVGCEVIVYSEDRKVVLIRFEPSLRNYPWNPIYFSVADSMLDRVQVRYTLKANELQVHQFTIEPEQLKVIANEES